MPPENLRRQIAFEAARLLYARDESVLFRARLRAARQIAGNTLHHRDLPSIRQIQDQIEEFARADRRELSRENLGRLPDFAPAVRRDAWSGDQRLDRFHVYAMLLAPLEEVHENRESHPEGDVLYHSLQVFELARAELPYDEEFLLAALLHDVGKSIDPRDHARAAVEALDGFITPRTAWFIEHHPEGLALDEGTLGARCRRRLQESADYEELRLLARCDRRGRDRGVATMDVEEALGYLRELAEMCGE